MDWRLSGREIEAAIASGWRVDASLWYGGLGVVCPRRREVLWTLRPVKVGHGGCTEVLYCGVASLRQLTHMPIYDKQRVPSR